MTKAAAIYLRLSREDIDVRRNSAGNESNSISAQRNLIARYMDENPELCHLPRMEFCDDGYSGTDFSRPGFQRMIERTKKGEIGCIIVKDLSRFGRDYLEVGDYLEHIFPFLGIRFISVNDQYDSASHNGQTMGMDVTFRNLVYDYYSRDLSEKVRTAVRSRQEKGEYLVRAVYGYKPSPENKHRMVIDEPTAEIVREVFDAVIAGKSTSEIAADLNTRGVPTPNEYKGIRRSGKIKPQWTHSRIVCMIRDIKYTGVMTGHTRESRYIRDKNQRRVPMNEWIITPDAHEAIVSRETWELANETLRNPKKTVRTISEQPDRVYYCAHCGRKLRRTCGSDQYYSCGSARYQRESACSSVWLKRSEMEKILEEALHAQIALVKQAGQEAKKEQRSAGAGCRREIGQAEKELIRLRNRKLERYEAYRSGEISREEFIRIKEELTLQAEKQSEKKEQLEQRARNLLPEQENKNEAELHRAEKVIADVDSGLQEHLYEAIDRVIVTGGNEIEIRWAFADIFARKED